jgi:flagellar L-ring protein precursor FlgH
MKRLAGALFATCAFACSALSHADSLFAEGTFQPLVSDYRAYRPGDSLTVLIVENASAAASADTTTEKSGGLGIGFKTHSQAKSATIDLNEDSAGKGKIQRTGKLLAQITVTVQTVEKNGELTVKGEQLLEFNNEKQQIRVEGRVRPRDISQNNTVLSTRVADARISYVGDGILGEKQSPGILTRLLSLFWLL